MDDQTANKLDRLLAGDGISGPEADAIFARVLREVERDEGRRGKTRALWAGVVAALVAAAAAALIATRPGEVDPPEFAVRGGASPGPRLEVICANGSLAACPISSTLIFAVSGDATSGFLSAYAEPLDPNAERVWYFSSEGDSPKLPEVADGTRVFERAVRLAGAHRSGRYRVHVILASTALGREEMLAGAHGLARASLDADMNVVGP